MKHDPVRRQLLAGAASLGALAMMPRIAHAEGSVVSAVYPGSWEEAYRSIVAPALSKAHGVTLEMQPLYAVDQIAKARAARGNPLFDTFLLDPGPRVTAIDAGLFEKFDPSRLSNASKLQPGMADEHGVTIAAQFVGIAYNPKKFDKPPVGWADLFAEPYVSRLGLTGFQTTFGTVSILEMSKAFGAKGTDVEPFFAELKKALPKIAVIGAPASMPSLFQQGQCDIMYANTQTVGTLKARGVDIEFVRPASGVITFFTTMHIAKGAEQADNAYRYIDTVLSAPVQTALMKGPYFMAPVASDVKLDDTLPLTSLAEMSSMVQHDWAQINPQRAAWIERFNREVAR
ncbi:extracellular solute-binding protein [Bordetella muralis]|jgi:putative spermidine/putrescine transport system substrate-binding protein|uniref:extracellular solute-binding protein n=1 Tax=Bordetella muralis TaxID=1649130 RepID=UPI0039EFF3C4